MYQYKFDGKESRLMAAGKINESDYRRNNLDKSSSPYLLQHTDNPVWWQEWSDDLINYALSTKKLLFVSVGYATCHWCHVMAIEAFSDTDTANYLNSNFICIKVDREQRPDIDQFLMDFLNNQSGRGGWPLNVFMTPDLRPVYALTYAPVQSSDSMRSLQSLAEKVLEFYETNNSKIPPFNPSERKPEVADENSLGKILSKYYDPENGGFGIGQKFPPHSSLLFLLFQPGIEESPSVKTICNKTLDAMRLRGLNDHLQGGIFRYCVDKEWTIPHFEKMLYDQAMSLWCYSLAYRVIGREAYKIMAEKILRCLDECFKKDGFYITGLDADTEHEEGVTYLWSYEELKDVLSPEEFEKFSKSYFVQPSGNFEGLIHLIRVNDIPLEEIEDKLLTVRRTWKQPSRDDKILCGINALLAVSMIQAGRFLGRLDLEKNATYLVLSILNKFWDGKSLKHSFYNGSFEEINFLFDAAALLTAISMLYETEDSWGNLATTMAAYVESFREGSIWREASAPDFQTVYASWTDHPAPSSVSLAEMGLTRVKLISGEDISSKEFREPFKSDFYNITSMMSNGLFHIVESANNLSWSKLPVNTIMIRGTHETDCFMGTCRPLGNEFKSD
jgi:uncharacterized protein YyaL (SSP411 family)